MMTVRHILPGEHVYRFSLSACFLWRRIVGLRSFINTSGFISHLQLSQRSWTGCVGLVKDVFLTTYRQAQVSTDILGYTFKTTFLFSSKNRTLSELILSGTQQGSGMPGIIPTAFTMLWIVAWFDGRTIWNREGNSYRFIYKQSLSQMDLDNDNNYFFVSQKSEYMRWSHRAMQHSQSLTLPAFLCRVYPTGILCSLCCLHKYQRRALVAQPAVSILKKECP